MQIKSNGKNLLIIAGIIALISGLLYYEQVAIIFVLSNIALIILLLSVGFADLEKKFGKVSELTEKEPGETNLSPDSLPQKMQRRPAKMREEVTNL